MTEKEIEEQINEMNKCKNDVSYFIEKYTTVYNQLTQSDKRKDILDNCIDNNRLTIFKRKRTK